jgi:formate hydrogenlyase transcriptional activator
MFRRELVGESEQMRAVLEEIRMVAPMDCSVLILGETGTGKELIARATHDESPRCNNPFIALNCAAIPGALLESELFGHEKGAFTGAIAQTSGKFLAAQGGTLFLDEIGDLPLELQPKLLRVLQEHRFERVGSNRTIPVNVRIVAATNLHLEELVRERQFRADLYYRLNVFPIKLPPLRERSGDIELLGNHFVRLFAAKCGKTVTSIPNEVMQVMLRHSWPGNVRELQNFIERSVIMSTGSALSPRIAELELMTPYQESDRSRRPLSRQDLIEAERARIVRALNLTKGIVGGPGGAAARLGIPRTTLISRMQRLGLSRIPSLPALYDAPVPAPKAQLLGEEVQG